MHVAGLAVAFLLATKLAAAGLDAAAAARFARLALDCVHREYPNKIAHALESSADVKSPRELTPAFYGCYDWHSSVHGHWLLARLARQHPGEPFAAEARRALSRSLTAANIDAEVRYLEPRGRASFERPYGLAWLLQLAAELREWEDPGARRWSAALAPLETAVAGRVETWLPKLSRPNRSGEHAQTAFALGLMLDWARSAGDTKREELFRSSIERFYRADRSCPVAYEPAGEDFVSPCLGEADAMRRVLPPAAYARWLGAFLPRFDFTPAVSTDRADGKLAHADGLNLSRAWMLDGIASGLPTRDARRPLIERMAREHEKAGLAAVTGEHYEGGHWLGSFAVYLTTKRGLPSAASPSTRSPASPRR